MKQAAVGPTMRLLALQLTLLATTAFGVTAQAGPPLPPSGDSVTVTPGAHYEARALHRAFMGAGYRDLWTTPIRVPVADLGTLGGGLTPVRIGGGTTTRTLHLDGADGRRYVLRSVDKEPVDLIGEFAGTPIESILRDQMSSFHPSGAPVVAALLDAVSVLHVEPRLVVVADDPELGPFRAEFAGMLALFEERPDDAPEGGTGFAGSRRVIQTARLFEVLEEEPGSRVHARELLASRLVDILVGDRDRSANNYLWAGIEEADGGVLWRPIPRDRDQAFVQLDGLLKRLARSYEPRLVHFRPEYPSLKGLTRNAWDIDRNLLVGLGRESWTSTVRDVRNRLTDPVIDAAVRRMPAEHHARIGADLASALRSRRDALGVAAEELYRIVFEFADVHATDEAEVATVRHLEDGSVRIVVTPAREGASVGYDRVFDARETREIRLYLHGGSDEVTIEGPRPEGLRVRIIGGAGRDRLVDRSTGPGEPIRLYDGGDATEVAGGGRPRHHRRGAPRPFSWLDGSRTLDWGTSWVPEPRFAYDADRGLVLTAGVTIDRHGFLKEPYASRIRLRAGWSWGLSASVLDYRHFFRDALGSKDFRLLVRWSGIELIDYYGLGNETPALGPASFHRVPHKRLEASALVSFGDGDRRFVDLGPTFAYTSTDTTTATGFLAAVDPYGGGGFGMVGLLGRFEHDRRDRAGTPSRGTFLSGGASYYPGLLDLDRGGFGSVHGLAVAYLSPRGGNPTLALRAAGKRLWGAYPFTEAAYLGGSDGVRGLNEQRYAGDASVLGSAELRLFLARLLFLVPADFGVFALSDGGRVFLDGDPSDTWRSSWGGGIWLAPVQRTSTVHVSVARASTGRTAFYFGVGFSY